MTAQQSGSPNGPRQDDRSHAYALAFRAALEAMARPGTLRRAEPSRPAPEPLSPAAAALLGVLSDADAPYWLAPSLSTPEIIAYARFETGAAPAATPEQAAFLFGAWRELAPLATEGRLSIGSPEYPDRSATLIVALCELDAAAGADRRPLVFSGPGVKEANAVHARGALDGFIAFAERNRRLFPLGIDLFLTAGDAVVGAPRTAHIRDELVPEGED